MRIDAHQHFWLFDPLTDTWITEEMKVIQRNFLPNDISKTLKDHRLDGAVLVQAHQSLRETDFLIELADAYKMVKAVIGWIDLRAEDIEEQLLKFSGIPIVKGFRHNVKAEMDVDFLMQDSIQRGIRALTQHHYTYDLLIHPRHYTSTLQCVASNPEQAFMLDHMAKPAIVAGEFDAWASFIDSLSVFPNVYCKISGLVTQVGWENWSFNDCVPYVKHVISCFGQRRVCFGSDWPKSLVAATYEEVLSIAERCVEGFDEVEQADFWGRNAVRFYGIT
ncbi:amidohydrolase family protein [Sphingobacterium faecale]|uniref:Amidohydrolase family protein n=1 Tax=Sphingobacterium faecale TaxID=2803775 RepID=A0ABS1R1M6_9SPHI|nr:amidohydrolase family protein [Sphingobacterium faecale]MBL1408375.1 amidohydrolase family protein [Sphingobacterium faecale]